MSPDILSVMPQGVSGLAWFIAPILGFFILLRLAVEVWLYWRQEIFRRQEQILFEMRIPREVNQNPQAMEQVLTAIHGLRNLAGDIGEKWWDGEVTRTFSLEIVSFGGEIHWYIRCYWKSAPLVKAAFFAYYPDVELVQTSSDYTDRFPDDVREMNAQGYEMYSTEILLAKEDAYPIRTYKDFESPDEDKQYDPVSALIEFLAQTQREQIVAVQILLIPAEPNWAKKFSKLVEQLKESASAGGGANKSATRVWDFSSGPLPILSIKGKEKKEDNLFKSFMRTPGETDTLKAVEENLSKPAFETLIRFLYFSPKPLYYDSFAKRGVIGSFNQYQSGGLNAFVPNYKTVTLTKLIVKPYIFSATRAIFKKERALYNYRHRVTPPLTTIGRLFSSHIMNWNFATKTFYFTTQSLATIFHPPTKMVTTTPHMVSVDSRKAGPPAGLAIFGEEQDVERFQ